MNPLLIFDYCYYKIAYFYKSTFILEHQKEFASILLISLLQLINFETLLLLMANQPLSDLQSAIGYLILLITNFVRYKKIITYSNLSEKWNMDRPALKHIKSLLVIAYIVFTFVFIVLAS
jgi:hypothetical protein